MSKRKVIIIRQFVFKILLLIILDGIGRPEDKAPAEASLTRPWPADQVERWPIERLIPYANNPRLHSEDDLDKIGASILKGVGQTPRWSTKTAR